MQVDELDSKEDLSLGILESTTLTDSKLEPNPKLNKSKNESKPEVRLAQLSIHMGDRSSLFHDQQ